MTDTAIAMPIAWFLSYTTLALTLTMGIVNALYISIIQTLVLHSLMVKVLKWKNLKFILNTSTNSVLMDRKPST